MVASVVHYPSTVDITCDPCQLCDKQAKITVDKEAYYLWLRGLLVQEAFPDMSQHDRELLISGTHPECFGKLFPPED